MAHRVLRIGGGVVLAAGVLAAIAAVSVVVIGVLALSGRMAYPVSVGLGPISFSHQVSMPVSFHAAVCQSASVNDHTPADECQRFIVHDADSPPRNQANHLRVQDADVRPTSASLTGTVALTSTGGWSDLVAASVARTAILLAIASAMLVLVSRLLATLTAGAVSHDRSVRRVRAIGGLVIVGGVVDAIFDLFASPSNLGYSTERFGPGPYLDPGAPGSVDVLPMAVGALLILVAEVFRRGAAVDAGEAEKTVAL